MNLAAIWPVTHRWCLGRQAAAHKASFAVRNISLGLGVLAVGGLLVGCAAPAGAPSVGGVPLATAPSSDPLIAFVSGASEPSAAAPRAAPAVAQPNQAGLLEPYRPTLDGILGAAPQADAPTPAQAPAFAGASAARFRIIRSYSAASGAECREVAESSGASVERLRLVCREPTGVWREARPLLSGISQRP